MRSHDVCELVPALAEPSSSGQVQLQPLAHREGGKICRLLKIRKPNSLLKKGNLVKAGWGGAVLGVC